MYLSFTLLIWENNTAVSYDGFVWTEYTEESIIMLCSGSQRGIPLALKEPGVILS